MNWTSPCMYINPPLLSLCWYGCKSLAKCFIVVLLLSFMNQWPQIQPLPTSMRSKKGAGMTTKEKVICEMSWLCGLCNVKQFAWLLPIDLALQLKPQRAVRWTALCHDAWAGERNNFSDVQLSQLTVKAKASWMPLKLRDAEILG